MRGLSKVLFPVTVASVVLMTTPARALAQSIDLAVGYSFLYVIGPVEGSNYPTGWLVAVTHDVAGGLAVVGEVGCNYRTDSPEFRFSFCTFMAGPRIEPSTRAIRPFAQVLFGDARAGLRTSRTATSLHHFLWQPGGGINIPLGSVVGIRTQGDFLFWPGEGSLLGIKNFRFAIGAVFRLRD